MSLCSCGLPAPTRQILPSPENFTKSLPTGPKTGGCGASRAWLPRGGPYGFPLRRPREGTAGLVLPGSEHRTTSDPGLFPDLRPVRAFRFGEQVAWMVEDAALNR